MEVTPVMVQRVPINLYKKEGLHQMVNLIHGNLTVVSHVMGTIPGTVHTKEGVLREKHQGGICYKEITLIIDRL